ncbi:MAG: helix-turn-helix domain-containing protein [Verrucomicrobiota bacterium]
MKSNTPKTPDGNGRFLLPLREVAAMVALSRETLYRRIRQGIFPAPIKQGNRSFFEPADVQNYLGKLKRKH